MSKWLYNDTKFTKDDVKDYASFVYMITNKISGKKYIGKKIFTSIVTRPPLKGYKRKRKIRKDSGWEKYCSSSKYVLADIEELGEDNFKFEIIQLCNTRAEANYGELKYQIFFGVLEELDENGNRVWYNENISQRYYFNEKENNNRVLLTEKLINTIN